MSLAHRIRRAVASRFADRPFLLQRLWWPVPFRPPCLQREINLFRPGELGDVVMSLAVVRAIRERNPTARINFITNYHELLAGHPLIDGVYSLEQAKAAGLTGLVSLRYEAFIPLRLHVIDYLAGSAGLEKISKEIPLPRFEPETTQIRSLIGGERPWVMVCRSAGPFTVNKDWPDERWDALIKTLSESATVVELGASKKSAVRNPQSAMYLDLRGKTTVRQFCAAISLADVVVTPVTSALHVAAAYKVPVVSVMSGYEAPENTAYPGHTAVYEKVPCAPCWLRTPCPIGLECLQRIRVDQVTAAVRAALPR